MFLPYLNCLPVFSMQAQVIYRNLIGFNQKSVFISQRNPADVFFLYSLTLLSAPTPQPISLVSLSCPSLSLQVLPPLMTSPSGLLEGASQCPLVVVPTSHLSVKQQDTQKENDNSQSAGLKRGGGGGDAEDHDYFKVTKTNKRKRQNTESSCLTCHNATMLI